MDPLLLIFGVLAVLALGISVVTLVLAWGWSKTPPEYAALGARLTALDQSVIDVEDRLGQWMRRETVRKMREGKERSLAAAAGDGAVPGETPKQALRRRVFGVKAPE